MKQFLLLFGLLSILSLSTQNCASVGNNGGPRGAGYHQKSNSPAKHGRCGMDKYRTKRPQGTKRRYH